MDDVNGIIRIVEQNLGKWIASGKVVSVTASRANVNIGSDINAQPCSYDPSSGLVPGDEVILVKAPRQNQWSIVAVTFRKTAGLSNVTRVVPNNQAGAQKFTKSSTNGGAVVSVTAASGQSVNSVSTTFNGGKAMIIYNGSATIASGSSILTLSPGVDSVTTTAFAANIGTTSTPINFTWVSTAQLYGPHTVDLFAGRSSANVSLTNYQYIVMEI